MPGCVKVASAPKRRVTRRSSTSDMMNGAVERVMMSSEWLVGGCGGVNSRGLKLSRVKVLTNYRWPLLGCRDKLCQVVTSCDVRELWVHSLRICPERIAYALCNVVLPGSCTHNPNHRCRWQPRVSPHAVTANPPHRNASDRPRPS